MRRPLLVANWKMHKDRGEARVYADALRDALTDPELGAGEIVIAPPFTALETLAAALVGSPIALGAQDVSPEAEGAHTGEVSAPMLADLGCKYCIVGHSERRGQHGETSAQVSAKAGALLKAGLRPILCVGETQAQRAAGKTAEIVAEQLQVSLPRIDPPAAGNLVVAYEPIWAIGTGVTATPEQAQEVHALLRKHLRTVFGAEAEKVRLQYGGSVGPGNIQALMSQPDIDGALIGNASLTPETFGQIIANSYLENTSP
ncbi:MAG TPA: triose-phosphate isomerase [Myxococcales bacterium]|nr:triose-phosphate isomerase [Myxococcales bacterium]